MGDPHNPQQKESPTFRVNVRDVIAEAAQEHGRTPAAPGSEAPYLGGVAPQTIRHQRNTPEAIVEQTRQSIMEALRQHYQDVLAHRKEYSRDPKKMDEAKRIIGHIASGIPNITSAQAKAAAQQAIDDLLGIGRHLEPFMRDPEVTEIMAVGTPRGPRFFIERNGRIEPRPEIPMTTEDTLQLAVRLVEMEGRRLNQDEPRQDVQLASGARAHMDIPPITHGPTITIRKPPSAVKQIDVPFMLKSQTITQEMLDFLKMSVEGKLNILVIGATGSGKTTLSRYLLECVPRDERIGTLEDTFELNPHHPHVVAQQAVKRTKNPIGIPQLFESTLRQRLDRIIVGEVRISEGSDLLESWRSGHPGGITTIHAGDARDAIDRLVDMLLVANRGANIPVERLERQIHRTLDLIVYARHFHQDGSRKITRIVEVLPIEDAPDPLHALRDLWVFKYRGMNHDGRVVGEFKKVNDLTPEKRLKVIEFGVTVPDRFGGPPTDAELGY